VSLGGNQGDTRAIFQEALSRLVATPGVRLDAASSLYRTPPWGDEAQPPFLNAVIRLETGRDAFALFRSMQALETSLGRRRDPRRRWGPRTLDLDLLLFGAAFIDDPELTVPHPRLHERAFVLVPLAEIEPDLVIPGAGSVSELLDRLDTTGIEPVFDASWAARA
jgi:2-amino-4-hydroxy-6-hydroxymethyldihydropteridine diphosphokinase